MDEYGTTFHHKDTKDAKADSLNSKATKAAKTDIGMVAGFSVFNLCGLCGLPVKFSVLRVLCVFVVNLFFYLCLCTNRRLDPMLITAMPAKNVSSAGSPPETTFPKRNRR